MRTVQRCVVMLMLAASPAHAAAGSAGKAESPSPARDRRLEFALIGGAAGGTLGTIGWHLSGPHTVRRDSAGRAAVVGTILGAGIGVFIASFSLPSSTTVSGPPAAAPLAVGSHVAFQPVISRAASAAIVRLRF